MLLSKNGVVALEGVSIDSEVEQLLQPHIIAPTLEIQPGTLYPTSKWLHVRATDSALSTLNEIVNTFADPQVCDHLYGYENGTLIFEWTDAFSDPIHVSEVIEPAVIAAFCATLGVDPAKRPTAAGR